MPPTRFQPGLVHAPVTPFTSDGRLDFATYEKLIEFHIRNGADALALPMHVGESVSLPDEEKRRLIAFAVERARGRLPIIAHVSDAGTAVAAALARHAEAAGTAAVVATTPYYWTPPPTMILEHFAQIGGAVKIPFFVHNAPEDMAGVRVSAELMLKLMERLDNFAGLIDASLDWQFMIELMTEARRRRPGFLLLAGTEHLVSAGAIGAFGMLSTLAAVAPRRVRRLYDLCRAEKYVEARPLQGEIAALRQTLAKADIAHLKAALRTAGRDCGEPRPPLRALDPPVSKALAPRVVSWLSDEPRGW
jgi:4-hydroxy-tetrahydrodipicolinate synthase